MKTQMPGDAKRFVMQRVRWARNSYRCYLRAAARGWVFRQPAVTQVIVAQKVLFPVSVTTGLTFTGLAIAAADPLAVVGWAAWTLSGRGIQVVSHPHANRVRDLPALAFILVLLIAAIKYYGFFTMRRQDWMTRGRERVVAAGRVSGRSVPAPRPLADERAKARVDAG